MNTDKMLSRREGSVGRMIFNNPQRHNAVSLAMWRSALQILQAFLDDDAVRVIVLSGAGGKAFVSGADISKFDSERATSEAVREYNAMTAEVYQTLHQAAKPTVAQIDGYCIGGGLNLAVCCDLRVCSAGSKFGLPAAKLGLGYPLSGLKRLADVVGLANAKEICFTARRYDAAAARAMGLVQHVVDGDLDAFIADYAAAIAANAPLTISSMKQIFNQLTLDPAQRDPDYCQSLVDRCFASEDYIEGRRAFIEKRPADFKGR